MFHSLNLLGTYQQTLNGKKHTVKILNKGGINSYTGLHFNQKDCTKHYKVNQKLRVKSVKHLNRDITRYQLANGHFITTNKHFVRLIK
ncbi:DUF5776 domain-containing protein [Apilactobacillus xinyiensis]|uniref:DUF5776 domain-containing protein n=1 Tax=Apilactobacillus xinyiensis TaxID=2841032 RepID=UPI00200DC0BE|nr:DUF5776 domain-containing protein [Apilactobacillus xinyiensis]MCL0330376.1 DUF5776 domain-containing protein [Apilactobacillus xinyiensis]